MKRVLLFLTGMLFLFSCEYQDNGVTSINEEITQDYLLTGTLDSYIQNTQIVRLKGTPGVKSITIGSADLTKYEPCFILHVATGTTQATIVSSAIIKLDDMVVLNTSDFSKDGGQFQFEVCNLTATSVLTVEVRGEPDSYIDVWIEGKKKEVKDCNGYVYKTIKIGNQLWMAENLRTTCLNDGTPISKIEDNTEWANSRVGAYCWYQNSYETYGSTYGALYNWYAVSSGKLCPEGWHVASYDDWQILFSYLGGTGASSKLREAGTTHWLVNTDGTNESGFTALPGGARKANGGVFTLVGWDSRYWSSTESDGDFAQMTIVSTPPEIMFGSLEKWTGNSVRCMQNK